MDLSGLDTARSNAQGAATNALNWQTGGLTLADELRKAIGERFEESDVAKQSATARSNFLAAAPQARADILSLIQGGSILSPTQQNAIMASKRAAALAPVMGTNVLQEAQFGTLEDLINAGTNAWNAQATNARGVADIARQGYSDLLSELVTRQNLEQSAQKFPLELQQLRASIASTGRGSSGTWSNFTGPDGKEYLMNSLSGEIKLAPGIGEGLSYENELQAGIQAVRNGTITKEEATQTLLSAFPQKSGNISSAMAKIEEPKSTNALARLWDWLF